jgi:hypothetical protein
MACRVQVVENHLTFPVVHSDTCTTYYIYIHVQYIHTCTPHIHTSPCCFNSLFHWTGTGWCENSTKWKSCKQVRARGNGAWACLAHALQCLCDGRACCPARALQLVICRSSRFHRCTWCFNFHLWFTGNSLNRHLNGNHIHVRSLQVAYCCH